MGVQVPPAAPASPGFPSPKAWYDSGRRPPPLFSPALFPSAGAVRMSATLPEPVPRKRHSVRNQVFLAILFGLLIAFSAT